MSRELFRLVGVWNVCWVVRHAPPSNHSTDTIMSHVPPYTTCTCITYDQLYIKYHYLLQPPAPVSGSLTSAMNCSLVQDYKLTQHANVTAQDLQD
jgi:hypothetical protein